MATNAPATKKSSKGRKSAAIALAVVGVAGLALASAATLTINSSSLGAGTSVVAACDSDGITVGYTNTYAATGYQTTGVVLSGVADKCAGLNYKVQLTQLTGTTVTTLGGELTGTFTTSTLTGAADNKSATLSLTTGVAASDVKGVSVVIFS